MNEAALALADNGRYRALRGTFSSTADAAVFDARGSHARRLASGSAAL